MGPMGGYPRQQTRFHLLSWNMTREEYRQQTDIQTTDEAKRLQEQFRLLLTIFGGVWLLALCSRYIVYWLEPFFLIGYIVMLVVVFVYARRIIVRTRRVSRADILWAVLFAPISWFWFYPEVVKPLRIIMGELEPPTASSQEHSREAVRRAGNKRFWRTIKIVFAVSALVLVGMVIYGAVRPA